MAKDPICGMSVEEKNESIHYTMDGTEYYFCSNHCLSKFTEPQKELSKLKKQLVTGIFLTVPIIILTYIPLLSSQLNHFVLFALATPVQFWIGSRFYKGTVDSLKTKTTNMDVLIAIGTTTAWLYSSIVTFIPDYFPFNDVYFETSAVIIMLILTGNLLEQKTKTKALGAVRKLLDLQPRTARIIRNSIEEEVPVEQIRLDDTIIVRPGEKIPTDGLIIDGHSQVDQSAITGESIPVPKDIGDEVIGATINKNGILKVKATKIGKDTVLSQIIHLVEEAKSSKVPLQRLVDKVTSYFVPVIVIIAISSGLAWFFLGGIGLTFSILAFVSVIIIACPCAIGIATPTALMVGASKAAENGILVKGGEYLEIARRVKTIVFDKTGTLTKGHPSVTEIIVYADMSESEVLRLAAISEKNSEHPIAEAIVNSAKDKGLSFDDASSHEILSGYGIRSKYGNHIILIGNRKLLSDNKIDIKPIEQQMQFLEKQGKTVVILAMDEKILGLIAMADTIKENTVHVISELKNSGMEVIMITGDNKKTANYVANQLKIDKVYAEVLPDQKDNLIKMIQNEGKMVAMVGDGINDAPALATADIGIAIGSGTDVAKETGGIILIGKDLSQIITVLELAKKTSSKIKQNLAWAFGYNTAVVPIAAGVLVPFFGPEMFGFLPFLAAGAMAFSDVTVIGNSLLLNRYKPRISKISHFN